MSRKKPASLRKIYVDAFADRGVAGLETLGFRKAKFAGLFHGNDPNGYFAPMLRQTGPLLEILDVLFAPAQPHMPIVQVYVGLFDAVVPAPKELEGAEISAFLMAAQHPVNGRFHLARTGWRALFDGSRRYAVKAQAAPGAALAAVDRAIGRILADAELLPQTRLYHLRRKGVWMIAMQDRAVVPLRHLPKGSTALREVLAAPPFGG